MERGVGKVMRPNGCRLVRTGGSLAFFPLFPSALGYTQATADVGLSQHQGGVRGLNKWLFRRCHGVASGIVKARDVRLLDTGTENSKKFVRTLPAPFFASSWCPHIEPRGGGGAHASQSAAKKGMLCRRKHLVLALVSSAPDLSRSTRIDQVYT